MIDSGFHFRFRLSRKNSENTQICIFYDLLAISRKRKELSEIHWWRNNRSFGVVSRNADCDDMCDTSVQKSVFWIFVWTERRWCTHSKALQACCLKKEEVAKMPKFNSFWFYEVVFPWSQPKCKEAMCCGLFIFYFLNRLCSYNALLLLF